MTYVNAGASYYNLNNFDSANYFLLKAESQINKFSAGEDKMRLYNTLGVLYHDNGNYLQSRNYFNQALEISKTQGLLKPVSIVSLESNIATAYFKLGQFDEALTIYKKILRYHVFTDFIYMNMGRAYASLKQYRDALDCFRRVDGGKMPWVYNEVAYAQMQVGKLDSSAYYLDHWQKISESGQMNKIDLANNSFYRASLLAEQKQWKSSLENLQKAIILFTGNFKDENIFHNPEQFTGTFAYYRLFEAISEKASIFEKWYQSEKKEEYLQAAFSAFSSTLALLSYIEKSYDTDDAKMLLKKKSRHIYQEALNVCLELHHLHPDDGYLEKAFLITEKNKASIVVASLREKNMRDLNGHDQELVQIERNIKYNIARLNVESDQAKDNAIIESIANEKSRYEIELVRVQKTLEENNRYYRIKYDDSYPRISELQAALSKKQAMISFYTTGNAIHLFVVTRSSFFYKAIDSLAALQADFANWIRCLKSTENGRRFKGEKIGRKIVDRLVRPIQNIIPEKDEWIIIPDGLLYFLPFESLPAGEGGEPLIESTTISYQFSSRFIMTEESAGEISNRKGVLSFAPFAKNGFAIDSADYLEKLPRSREEIAGLRGLQ
ncbi:MAG TPA: tetratricopeptide repeat protein, partial [Puia sp.]|nr:tetratricopeptide repeat protein [Puia sp.]